MLSAVVIDYIIKLMILAIKRMSTKLIINQIERTESAIFHSLYGAILAAVVYSFWLFSPLSYGIVGDFSKEDVSNNTMSSLRWLESWEF